MSFTVYGPRKIEPGDASTIGVAGAPAVTDSPDSAPPAPHGPLATRLFASHEEWLAAGRPIGGLFPVSAEDHATYLKDGAIPDRYRDTPAYYVALPNAEETAAIQLWCPWHKAFNAAQGWHGEGWNIDGPVERLTITPSIQTVSWHGYLTDGVLKRC